MIRKHSESQVLWHVSAITAFWRWKQELSLFKAILSYVVSLRPAWVTPDSVSKSQTEPKQQKHLMFMLVIRSKTKMEYVCEKLELVLFSIQGNHRYLKHRNKTFGKQTPVRDGSLGKKVLLSLMT